MSYYLIGKIQMTLTEGLERLQRAPFLVNRETGDVQLNFDPQQGMKGYFDFMVTKITYLESELTNDFLTGYGKRYWRFARYGKSIYISP